MSMTQEQHEADDALIVNLRSLQAHLYDSSDTHRRAGQHRAERCALCLIFDVNDAIWDRRGVLWQRRIPTDDRG